MKSNTSYKLILLCWLTIVCCTILKLFGCNDFNIPIFDVNIHHIFRKIINGILYCLNSICFIMILIKRKLKFKEYILIICLSIPLFTLTMFKFLSIYKIILEFLTYVILGKILTKDKFYRIIIECTLILILFTIYQLLTVYYKNINKTNFNFITTTILQLDYYILLILTILHEFKKGDYIYGRWKSFLVNLPKQKGNSQPLGKNQTSVQQSKTKHDVGFKIFIVLLSVTQLTIVGTVCYFINNTTYQFAIIFVSFVIMRHVFGKSYHADSVLTCTVLSCFVFLLATKLVYPSYITILFNVIIGCLIAYIMHIWYYYIKYTSSNGITIYKGMSQEDLDNLCKIHNLKPIEYNILNCYYIKKYKLDKIAIAYDYSVDNIKKIKANALKKLKED